MFLKGMIVSLVLLGSTAFAGNKDQFAANQNYKAEIQARLDEFASVWNTHDAKKMSEFWAEDGDLINPWGKEGNGRNGVFEIFEHEQNGMLKKSTQQFTVSKVRNLATDLVFVDAESNMKVVKENGKEKNMAHHVSFVMTKKNGAWYVLAARPYMFAPKGKGDMMGKKKMMKKHHDGTMMKHHTMDHQEGTAPKPAGDADHQ